MKKKNLQKGINRKYINQWLGERSITLEQGFVESLRALAYEYKKRRA